MRIDTNIPLRAQTSFLSVEKDMETVVTEIFKNDRIKKLLYHTKKDALSMPELTDEQTASLFTKNVKIVPKIPVEKDVLNYIIVSFDNFTGNATNPEFRDNIISFDIVCHFDQWQLNDLALRPCKIAAEIDTMFDNKHLTGIGTFQFLGANQIVLNDEFAGLSLMYQAIHGGEDKKGMLNPKDEENAVIDFMQYLEDLEMSGIDLE